MDVLWNSLGIVGICLTLFMIIFSVRMIVRERKQIRHLLTSGEKMPPWYTNATIHKYSELLFNGVLLIMTTADLALFLKHVASALLWGSMIFFLYSCSTFIFTIFEEAGQRRIARETGEELPRWPRSSRFHQGIATTILLLGLSVITLVNGLIVIKAQSFEVADRFAWLWGSLLFVGGLYWLAVRTLQVFKTHKHQVRSSSSSSDFPY